MKKILRSVFVFVGAFVLLLAPRSIYASCHGGSGLSNPLSFCTLDGFLVALLGIVIQIAFPVIILFIVYIGFRFVQESAAGNAEKMKDLRGYLLWALVGALIVLGAQALSLAIQATVEDITP